MKKRSGIFSSIIIAGLFLIGLGIFMYPTISDAWNKMRSNKVIRSYEKKEEEIQEDRYIAYRKDAEAYNQTLIGYGVPDVFALRENLVDEEYESLLNVNEDLIMGYIAIPSIQVNLPIYHYTTEEVLKKGAGHIFGSSLPVGGPSSHTVISAHRGLPGQKMFADLNLLQIGDYFYIHTLGESYVYEIDKILTVLPDEVQSLSIEKGEDKATLVTCTPYAVNTHRLLIEGHRVTLDEETVKSTEKKQAVINTPRLIGQIGFGILGILFAVGIYLLISFIGKKKKNSKKVFEGENNNEEK